MHYLSFRCLGDYSLSEGFFRSIKTVASLSSSPSGAGGIMSKFGIWDVLSLSS